MALTRSSVLHHWSSRYGPLPVIGGRPTHTRNSAGKVADGRGEYYDGIINTPRFAWESDRSTSVVELRAMLLLETARTNSVLWSRDLSNAAWAGSGTGSVALNAIGLDGVPSTATTLTDSDAAAHYNRSQTVTVVNDSATHTVRFWVAKDAITSRFPALAVALSGGATPRTARYHLNTSTGATATIGAADSLRVLDEGRWWLVEIALANNSTGNTALAAIVYPAIASTIGTEAVATTGACIVGHVNVELTTAVGSTPIVTTTAAATRAADAFYWTYPPPPQGMMVYTRHVERGTILLAGARLWEITASPEASPRLVVYNGGSGYAVVSDNGTTNVTSSVGSAPAHGDTVELVATVNPGTGAVQIISSVNGAAVSSGSVSGSNSLAAAWADTKFWLNSAGVGGAVGRATFADLRAVKYQDVVASTAQGIMDELRAFELGPNGDIL